MVRQSNYHKYGIRVIHWWDAVMGYDISVHKAGIIGAGEKAFIAALRSFDDNLLSIGKLSFS